MAQKDIDTRKAQTRDEIAAVIDGYLHPARYGQEGEYRLVGVAGMTDHLLSWRAQGKVVQAAALLQEALGYEFDEIEVFYK